MKTLALVVLFLAGCGVTTPFYISRGTLPREPDGREWHTCAGGGMCEEGYACVAGGYCEWCGNGDGVQTRCTNGND
jgi:hypothetical protein